MENFADMTIDDIRFWLPKFVVEARKVNGQEYPPDSVYGLCCGLERDLRSNDREINIFSDSSFEKFCQGTYEGVKVYRVI